MASGSLGLRQPPHMAQKTSRPIKATCFVCAVVVFVRVVKSLADQVLCPGYSHLVAPSIALYQTAQDIAMDGELFIH